jgi:DNA invertase Pin-like site-specific DNA recombinase
MSPKNAKRVALYLRVSTSEQTTRNQRRELHAVAQRHGWHVVATYEHAGVSGAKGRDKRPGFDRLMMAVARREIDMVAAWSVDRLGRSLRDLLGFLTSGTCGKGYWRAPTCHGDVLRSCGFDQHLCGA